MRVSFSVVIIGFTLLVQGCAKPQTTFASPDDAARALVNAVRVNDRVQLERILGPRSDELINSGDEVADRQSSDRFLAAFDVKHRLVATEESVTIEIGDGDWPFPIPVVRDTAGGQWRFDSEAGREEIISRRVGRNELNVIQVCQAIADAQHEYAHRNPEGSGVPAYAQRFISDAGKKNGLYWPSKEGESPSPLGPLVGQAVEQGYKQAAQPYHGYVYRILTSQGEHASGGTLSYIANDMMIGGFAVIAAPAQYGNSGVMTFIVNHQGVVYQKDLGEETEERARAITSFDPGEGWKKAE